MHGAFGKDRGRTARLTDARPATTHARRESQGSVNGRRRRCVLPTSLGATTFCVWFHGQGGRRRARHRTPTPTPPVNVTGRTDDRMLLSFEDAAERLEISRTMLYELISASEIHAIHVGPLRTVPVDALREYSDRQRALASDLATTWRYNAG